MTKQISGWKLVGMLIAAPFMGAAFCMFLPFIGIGMLLWFSGKKLYRVCAAVAERKEAPGF